MKKGCAMKLNFLIFSLVVVSLYGCTAVNVSSVDLEKNPIKHLCILESTKSNTRDFISAMTERFEYYNITVETYLINKPKNCDAIVTFEAYRSYDPIPFLNRAKIEIRKDNKIIGTATYRHKGGVMSMALTKYGKTRSKVYPLIDKLLAQASANNTSDTYQAPDRQE